MSQYASLAIRRPRTDERPLWDVVLGFYGYPAVLLWLLEHRHRAEAVRMARFAL